MIYLANPVMAHLDITPHGALEFTTAEHWFPV